jgi:Lon protease-like protein
VFTDAEVDAALDALSEPGRFRDAETRVMRYAPQLQRVLAHALNEGGWFGEAERSQVRQAAGAESEAERVTRIQTLLAEETRMGMLVGVAVGWELARELEMNDTEGD